MTSLFKQFATDETLEKQGVLLSYGVNERTGKEIYIRIARAGGANAKFARVLEAKLKPYRRQIQTETIAPAVAERLMREAYAEAVVIGWEEVDNEEGTGPLEFTVANVCMLFEKLPDLFKDVQEQAGKMTLFRNEVRDADAGN